MYSNFPKFILLQINNLIKQAKIISSHCTHQTKLRHFLYLKLIKDASIYMKCMNILYKSAIFYAFVSYHTGVMVEFPFIHLYCTCSSG